MSMSVQNSQLHKMAKLQDGETRLCLVDDLKVPIPNEEMLSWSKDASKYYGQKLIKVEKNMKDKANSLVGERMKTGNMSRKQAFGAFSLNVPLTDDVKDSWTEEMIEAYEGILEERRNYVINRHWEQNYNEAMEEVAGETSAHASFIVKNNVGNDGSISMTQMEITRNKQPKSVCYEVRLNTSAGNSVKEILLKLNLPDHRSIITDLKVTPTKHGRMTKPYSSLRFIANCFNAGYLKMEVKVHDPADSTRFITIMILPDRADINGRHESFKRCRRHSDTKRLSRSDEVLKLKNFKKDATLKLFKSTNQERYEHVGPEVTSSQDGKVTRWRNEIMLG
ncbi:hypothetical protein Tco_0438789 [Tanacetum coccineum]